MSKRVRYIKEEKIGFVSDKVAEILEKKGVVKILSDNVRAVKEEKEDKK